MTPSQRAELRAHCANQPYKPNKLDSELTKQLDPGWLRPLLLQLDHVFWGRWDYWFDALEAGEYPTDPIPQIEFLGAPNDTTLKMLNRCIEALQAIGYDHHRAIEFLIEWIDYGLTGTAFTLREDEKASSRLYQLFCLDLMILYPFDYFGRILSEISHGKYSGFFPTPLNIVQLMCQMTYGNDMEPTQSVYEPCLGTGRMLMLASNYSFCLSGQDVDATVLKCAKINLWMYAPWGAAPLRKRETDAKLQRENLRDSET